MKKRQRAAAIRVVERDCEIRERYIDRDGRTCAVGALAVAAGVELNYRANYNCTGIGSPRPKLVEMRRAIGAKFGLDEADLQRIQHTNDAIEAQSERRKKIAAFIRGPDGRTKSER